MGANYQLIFEWSKCLLITGFLAYVHGHPMSQQIECSGNIRYMYYSSSTYFLQTFWTMYTTHKNPKCFLDPNKLDPQDSKEMDLHLSTLFTSVLDLHLLKGNSMLDSKYLFSCVMRDQIHAWEVHSGWKDHLQPLAGPSQQS